MASLDRFRVVTGQLHRLMLADDVEITAITDSHGEEYKDERKKIDLKLCVLDGEEITIAYTIPLRPRHVTLWIEYLSSATHDDFYAQYQSGSFHPPVVRTLIDGETKLRGDHAVRWDGRDATTTRRLLLAGRYRVCIRGEWRGVEQRSESVIEVAAPTAYNFGIHYKKGGHWHSSKRETEHAALKQRGLQDGTAFETNHALSMDAWNALHDFRSAGVVYWSGHSNSLTMYFHDKEDVPFSSSDSSGLHVFGDADEIEAPNATTSSLGAGDLRDLFLVVLNGCRTGSDARMLQIVLGAFNPKGIDGVHGEKTTKALRSFQRIHDLTPADGSKNVATYVRLGIDVEGRSESQLTREVQRKLASYNPGKADGIIGDKSRRALRNYQRDHPNLVPTGEADEDTFVALKLGTDEGYAVNIAHRMVQLGADIALGFIHKIDFDIAESWAMKFWDNVAGGDGVNKAAHDAKALVDHRRREQCEFNLYTQDGVSPESTLHPARYGHER